MPRLPPMPRMTRQGCGNRFRPRVELLEERTLLAFDLGFAISVMSTPEAVTTDETGSVYVSGTTHNSFDVDPGPGITLLNRGLFVAKFSSDGELQWGVGIEGTSEMHAPGLAVDGTGNVYVGGNFAVTADFDPGSGTAMRTASWYDAFVLKLDNQGQFLWVQQFEGAGHDSLHQLALDANGNVIGVGYFTQTVDFDPGPGTLNLTAGGVDGFVFQLNPAGNLSWAHRIGGIAHDVAVDGVGGIYVAGQFTDTAEFGLVSTGGTDGYVLKFNGAGSLVYARNIGTSQYDAVFELEVDSAGVTYVAGLFDSPHPPLEASFGVQISKYDADGTLIWTGSGGYAYETFGIHGMVLGPNGVLYLAGFYRSTSDLDPGPGVYEATSQATGSGTSAFISQIDADGNLASVATIDGDLASARAYELTFGSTGKLYAVGIGWGDVYVNTSGAAPLPDYKLFLIELISDAASLGTVSMSEDGSDAVIDLAAAFAAAGHAGVGPDYSVQTIDNSYFGSTIIDGSILTLQLAVNAHGSTEILIATQDSTGAAIYGRLTIIITPVSDLPSAADDSYEVDMGGSLTVGVLSGLLANDEDADGDLLTVIDYSEPSHGTVTVNADGSFTYQSTGTTPVDDSFSYTISAAGETATAVVTIHVVAINQAPVADPLSLQVDEDETLAIILSGTDQDPEVAQSLTFTIIAQPGHGTLTDFNPLTGEVTYTPDADFNGSDSFTYTVTDDASGGGPALTSAPATVSIVVAAVNDAPTANAQTLDMGEDGSLGITLSGQDNDPEVIQTLRFTIVTGPSHGRLVQFSPGQYIYVPDLDFHGQDSFDFTVTDGEPGDELTSSPATVTITVNDLPDTNQVVVRVNPDQPDSNVLIVSGSARNERIVIKSDPAMPDFVIVKTNNPKLGSFTVSQVISRVIVRGFEGHDALIAKAITHQEAELHGGSGKDTLQGGLWNDILLGEGGHDLLKGRAGRDLLIGGGGRDTIIGGSGEDIVIDGSTAFDTDAAALVAILAEWSADSDYATRISNLTGAGSGPAFDARLNGDHFLTKAIPATVLADSAKDRLTGGGDLDWFFASGAGLLKDALTDRLATETVSR